jgi:hypothetical protein
MEILKMQEKMISLSDEKVSELYSFASHVSLETIEELAPALLRVCLNSEGKLKNELGRVIFHLQKNERLNTRIGFEKLLHGALKVNSEEVFKLLKSSDKDGRHLASQIKVLLEE